MKKIYKMSVSYIPFYKFGKHKRPIHDVNFSDYAHIYGLNGNIAKRFGYSNFLVDKIRRIDSKIILIAFVTMKEMIHGLLYRAEGEEQHATTLRYSNTDVEAHQVGNNLSLQFNSFDLLYGMNSESAPMQNMKYYTMSQNSDFEDIKEFLESVES